MSVTAYLFGLVLVVTAVGAVYDWRAGHIPHWLTLGALGVGILSHAVIAVLASGRPGDAVGAVGYSLLGAAACAIVPLVLYQAGAIGGGDVKLLAAVGAILRPMLGVEAELYAFVAVMIIMPGWLAYHGKLGTVLRNTLALAKNPFLPKDKRRQIPSEMLTSVRFGPAIFAGACGVTVV